MTAISKRVATVPAQMSEPEALFHVIERAATNPNIDIEKMERLIQMQERVMDRNARAAYASALADMQAELPVIKERGTIRGRDGKAQSTYALWEDVNEQIKPVLTKYGFALSFRTSQTGDKIFVTGILSHREGHAEETIMPFPIDTSGNKNAIQAVGSSISYGKRYTAGALLNLTSRGEDDDGIAAATAPLISEEQAMAIVDLIEASGANRAKFLEYLKVDAIESLPASRYDDAMAKLKAKAARNV